MNAGAGHDEAMPDGATELHALADKDENARGVDQSAGDQQAKGQRVNRLNHRLQREDRHPAEQDVDRAPERIRDARREHLHRHAGQGHGPDRYAEADGPAAFEPLGGEGCVAACDHQEDGGLVQPSQHGSGGAGASEIIDGRCSQHGHQTQRIDGCGHDRANADIDGRQHRQDHAADRRQGQAHGVDPEIGQAFRTRLIMLDHVEFVGRTHARRQGFQPHQHHPKKARASRNVPWKTLSQRENRTSHLRDVTQDVEYGTTFRK